MSALFNPIAWGLPGGVGFFLVCLGIFLYLLGRTGGKNDKNLYAINPNGTEKWRFATDGEVFSSPTIGADETIYVGSYDSNLYAINPDGTEKWRFSAGNIMQSSPAIGADGNIYVGSYDKKIYAINSNGTKIWEFETSEWVLSNFTIDLDGMLYVGTNEKKLYAIYGSSPLADTPCLSSGRTCATQGELRNKYSSVNDSVAIRRGVEKTFTFKMVLTKTQLARRHNY
jgi:outer membrane protein assembly factor BamB